MNRTHDPKHTATIAPRTTSQFVECEMGAAKRNGARSLAPTEMVIKVVVSWANRMMASAKKVKDTKEPRLVPPQVGAILDNLRHTASDTTSGEVDIHPGGDTASVKPAIRLSTATHECNLEKKSCTCGFPGLTKFPRSLCES